MPHDVTSTHHAGHLHPTKKTFRYELQHYAQLSFTQMLCPACGLECKCGVEEAAQKLSFAILDFVIIYFIISHIVLLSHVFPTLKCDICINILHAPYFRCSNFWHVHAPPGVCHGDDLFYLFPAGPIMMPPSDGPQDLQHPDDLAIRDIISKLWTNFAATG